MRRAIPWWTALVLLQAFSLAQRVELGFDAAARRQPANLLDHLGRTVLEPRLWVFVLVPWVLLRAHVRSDAVRSDMVRLRFGSQRRVSVRLAVQMLGEAALAVFGLTAASLAGGWGLPHQLMWSALAHAEASEYGLPAHPPVMLLCGQLMLGTALLWALGSFVAALGAALSERPGAGLIELGSGAVAFCSLFVAHYFADELGPANAALALAGATAVEQGRVPAAVLWIGVLLVVAWIVTWVRDHGGQRLRSPLWVHALVAALVLTVAVLMGPGGALAAMTSAFYGVGTGVWLWNSYLLHGAVFIGLGLAYGISLDERLSAGLDAQALRSGGLSAIVVRHGRRWLVAALLLPLAAAGWVAGLGALKVPSTLDLPEPTVVGYQVLVNGTLQTLVYLAITCGARVAVPSAVTPAAAAALMLAVGMPSQLEWVRGPSLLNSAAFAYDGWGVCLRQSLVLVGTLVVLTALIAWLLRRPSTLERNLA